MGWVIKIRFDRLDILFDSIDKLRSGGEGLPWELDDDDDDNDNAFC